MSTPFPDPIIKPFSNTGDNAPPPLGPISTAANQETGFPILEATPLNAGGIPVTREEFNGAFNFYTKQILALVSGCRFTFNQALSDEQNGYPIGAVLYSASDNSLQKSLVNNNTANFITTPSFLNDGVNWTAVVIDDIWCENLAIKDNGELALLNNTNTNAVTFKVNNTITNDQNYVLPSRSPPRNIIGSLGPQVLAGSYIGGIVNDLDWYYGLNSRLTYTQNSLISISANSNLIFSTYYDAINYLPSPDPGYYDVSNGVFTAPFDTTYKIEINLATNLTSVPAGFFLVDLVTTNVLINMRYEQGPAATTVVNWVGYIKLTHGQTVGIHCNTGTSYGNSATLPIASNQLSISWYAGTVDPLPR